MANVVAPSPSPNFAYLSYHDPRLVALGTEAEQLFAEHPRSCLNTLRLYAEILAQRAAALLGLRSSADTQVQLLTRLAESGAFDARVRQLFHDLRRAGNAASHQGIGDHREALHQLKIARELGIWFQRAFGNNRSFDPGPFVPPSPPAPDPSRERAMLEEELQRSRAELAATKVDVEAARAALAEEAARRLNAEQRAEKEAEERALLEELAHQAGAGLTEQSKAMAAMEAKYAADLAALQAAAVAAPRDEQRERFEQAAQASAHVQLDEAATRRLIDAQLRAAGWEVDTEALSFASGARPEKGKHRAIAEWPIGRKRADYLLFIGLVAVGVVEAKRRRIDVSQGALQQAEEYSRGFVPSDEATVAGGPWGERGFRVPFVFATNSRPYLAQIAEKSGVWLRDVRRDDNHGRPLSEWYTPEGLEALLEQDIEAANTALDTEPTDYLGLRDYQINAIRAVERALPNTDQRPALLVAMATGTGKTRTAIGLVYRLIKSGRFRRILFLVDRSALGEQTQDAFKDARLESLQTFAQIYDMKTLEDAAPEPETKLHIATIQGMVRRILFASDPEERPPVDRYDCVIVDECHRGYGLDREMSDGELPFRDLDDYVSKFRRVLDHFDAVKIGLTATPALHTTQIFGDPVFTYSYREAVIDGWLVDQEPPTRIITTLAEDGIHWAAGSEVEAYEPSTGTVKSIHLPDEVDIDLEGFNRKVRTASYNRVVCEELARHIDPSLEAKTLVFATTDDHADMLVNLLKEAFKVQYGTIEDGAVVKITGQADKPLQLIRRFKNEQLPSVVVTVDLLTTGVDIPKLTNLVFVRRVRSRILYEQMLGRATRLCPEIGKTAYRVFDAVDLYSAIEDYTDMVPVVTSPSIAFEQLVRELTTAPDEGSRQLVLEQLIAKLQRKRHTLKGEALARFEAIASMEPKSLAAQLKGQSPAEVADWFREHAYLLPLLDERVAGDRLIPISEHTDELRRVERGYGTSSKPEDYLEGFQKFIRANQNKIPALIAVTQRPRDLTRKELRALQLALSEAGYTDIGLQTAWRESTNADVAASILGFIRQAALGDPLVGYEERVQRGLARILNRQRWTDPQRQWLTRIAKQIALEKVVDREAFDHEPFKAGGGFARIDRAFDGKLEAVLGDLGEAIWGEVG